MTVTQELFSVNCLFWSAWPKWFASDSKNCLTLCCLNVPGTIRDYFEELNQVTGTTAAEDKGSFHFPTLTGDFFPYTDEKDEFWTGYFTTRPFDKLAGGLRRAETDACADSSSFLCLSLKNKCCWRPLLKGTLSFKNKNVLSGRELEQILRTADLLHLLASITPSTQSSGNQVTNENLHHLTEAHQSLGLFQHHDAITGTARSFVASDYRSRLLNVSAFSHNWQSSHGLDTRKKERKESVLKTFYPSCLLVLLNCRNGWNPKWPWQTAWRIFLWIPHRRVTCCLVRGSEKQNWCGNLILQSIESCQKVISKSITHLLSAASPSQQDKGTQQWNVTFDTKKKTNKNICREPWDEPWPHCEMRTLDGLGGRICVVMQQFVHYDSLQWTQNPA